MVSKVDVTDAEFSRLKTYNWGMGGLHLIQAIVILVLATDFALPVTAAFLEGPPGTPAATTTLFEVSIGWGVATFLLLSALFHFVVASIGAGRYRDQLSRGQNQFRWIEYSLSSSIMIV
ncbi:MAG: heliorhodopsin HeR, partial [Acidimicrobiia bacterium]|nr:heliorhodopsin HeR [Acidimicrobiia bacterium]